jgi:hypothetical protein
MGPHPVAEATAVQPPPALGQVRAGDLPVSGAQPPVDPQNQLVRPYRNAERSNLKHVPD